ncbi:transcription factor [Fusarium falciforme]|nr:transcription factor [Fusarium falciforme]
MVSREHATISFESKDERWFLRVKGRNGAKVDNQPLKAGHAHPSHQRRSHRDWQRRDDVRSSYRDLPP